jgi:hypothetical protein
VLVLYQSRHSSAIKASKGDVPELTHRKTILIYWTSRTFNEVILPVLTDLTRNFKIVVVLIDHSTPVGTISLLESLQDKGSIEKFYMTPDHRALFRNHWFNRKVARELRAYNFDFWLTASEIQPRERFLLDCVLPEHCTCIIMWHNITFLFMYNRQIVHKLLVGEDIPAYPPPRETVRIGRPISLSTYTRFEKAFREKGLVAILKIVLYRGGGMLRRKWKTYRKRWAIHFDRIIFPWLLVGRTFRLGPYDAVTQIGSGRSGVLILFDELEVKVHQNLYRNAKVLLAQYPTTGSCICAPVCGKVPGKKNAMLSPLSNFVGLDSIPDEALDLFYRDTRTVVNETGVKYVDLRLHPDESGQWPYELQDYLKVRGIEARVVAADLPLREVVCGYTVVAGSASASLRDCRAVCDYVLVIGFVGVSQYQFVDPPFVFAGSEGIGWIGEDGEYNKEIFREGVRKKNERKKVAEIINEFAEA